MTSIFSKIAGWFSGRQNQLEEIDPDLVPKHIAIIMDGNGRWAQRRGLPRIAGHRAGAKAIREVVESAPHMGVEYITLYTFSAENWRRPKEEVTGLMRLFREMLESELDGLDKNNVRLMTIGDLSGIDTMTREEFAKGVAKTKDNTGLTLVIALNYGGRGDIIAAIKKIDASRAGHNASVEISEQDVSGALSSAGIPDPELIVRTSGELRISNFLIWESAYSEFWVTDVLWPDFTREHLVEAIKDYQRRERRFGGLSKVDDDAR